MTVVSLNPRPFIPSLFKSRNMAVVNGKANQGALKNPLPNPKLLTHLITYQEPDLNLISGEIQGAVTVI